MSLGGFAFLLPTLDIYLSIEKLTLLLNWGSSFKFERWGFDLSNLFTSAS